MPTQRFMNLREEKKKAIVQAAVKEFARVPYAQTSINQIVKDAGISRGSFYTYFEDKDDLLRYVVGGFQEKCRQTIFQVLEEKHGDFCETIYCLLGRAMEQGGDFASQMYRNALTDGGLASQSRVLGLEGVLTRDQVYRQFIHELYERMDRERFPVADEETLGSLGEILLLVAGRAAAMFYLGMEDRDTLLRGVRKQLEILKNGASSQSM